MSNIVPVVSAKGGVGKTTVAVGLAQALLAQGFEVGLLDADTNNPAVAEVLGVAGRTETDDELHYLPKSKDGLKIMSVEFILGKGAYLWEEELRKSSIRQLLAKVVWGGLNWLIIDSPPVAGRELEILREQEIFGAVLVTHPTKTALGGTLKTAEMLFEWGLPILGYVINQRDIGFADRVSPDLIRVELAEIPLTYLGGIKNFKGKQEQRQAFAELSREVMSCTPLRPTKEPQEAKFLEKAVRLLDS